MSFNPGFSVSQSVQNPSVLTFSDTSLGTDAAISTRKIFLQKSDGSYMVTRGTTTTFIVWDASKSAIDLDCMDRDYALSVTVQWLDQQGTLLYTSTLLFCFRLLSELFLYGLTQVQISNPVIVDDTPYYENKMTLRMSVDEALNAVEFGSDILSAQAALDRGYVLIQNQQQYF